MKTPMQELIEWLDSIISVLPDSAVGAKNQMIVAKGKAESMLEKEKEVMIAFATHYSHKAFTLTHITEDFEETFNDKPIER